METLSIIKADTGGWVGHSSVHPEMLATAERALHSVRHTLIIDGHLFDDPAFDGTRRQANEMMDYLRRHGPFEPHRLPLDEMEYTTMPAVAERLTGRWEPIPDSEPARPPVVLP